MASRFSTWRLNNAKMAALSLKAVTKSVRQKAKVDVVLTITYCLFQDMTKADLYKRRSKNKQRKSSVSEPGTSAQADLPLDTDEAKEASLIETINNLKNRMNKNSIENDVELIKANTLDTPVNEEPEPNFEDSEEQIKLSVKPVEKTYAKSRSKLDEYIYIESSQGLEGTEVAFPKTSTSPVPRKRRKIDTRSSKKVNGDSVVMSPRRLRSSKTPEKRGRGRPKKVPEITEKIEKPSRTTKESIENDKTVVTRSTRKRKYEETASKPVLREKGQNRASKTSETRKIAKAKRNTTVSMEIEKILQDGQNVRMTRSRRRRLEISLSPSEVKSVIPAFSFESDRRVESVESSRSKTSNTKKERNKRNTKKTNTKPTQTNKTTKTTKTKQSKAKKPPVRTVRTRASRR